MFGKRKLLHRIETLESQVWQLRNPPEYNRGDKTKFGVCTGVSYKEVEWNLCGGPMLCRHWEYEFANNGSKIYIRL